MAVWVVVLAVFAKVCASLLLQLANVVLKMRDNVNDELESNGKEKMKFCNKWIGYCNSLTEYEKTNLK